MRDLINNHLIEIMTSPKMAVGTVSVGVTSWKLTVIQWVSENIGHLVSLASVAVSIVIIISHIVKMRSDYKLRKINKEIRKRELEMQKEKHDLEIALLKTKLGTLTERVEEELEGD